MSTFGGAVSPAQVPRAELVRSILQSCGYGRTLVLGLESPWLVQDLLAEGVDVWALSSAAATSSLMGRFAKTLPLVEESRSFETVVAIIRRDEKREDGMDPSTQLAEAIFDARGRRYFIVIEGDLARDEGTEAWMGLALEAGLLPHPLTHRVPSPLAGGADRGRAILLLERTADSVSTDVQPDALHVGVLPYVRPGDVVLDLTRHEAGGEFLARVSRAKRVVRRFCEPADLVISCLRAADALASLPQLRSWVRPGGRCVIQLSGESSAKEAFVTGADLDGFIVESVAKSFGGEEGLFVLVLLADLQDTRTIEERLDATRRDLPNILAFDRDYRSPAIVRAILSIGIRSESATVRDVLARKVLATAPHESADFGGALCALCYSLLAAEASDEDLLEAFEKAFGYAASKAAPENPTVLRWRISLAFVAGLVALRRGDRDGARRSFRLAAGFDPLLFSPLIATKTVAARRILGTLSLADGDFERARDEWQQGVDCAQRVMTRGSWREITGDPTSLATFGLPEAATVLLDAARCLSSIDALAEISTGKSHIAWDALHSTVHDELVAQRLIATAAQTENARLVEAITWAEEHRVATDAWIHSLNEGKNWLDEQRRNWESVAHERGTRIAELETEIETYKAERATFMRVASRDPVRGNLPSEAPQGEVGAPLASADGYAQQHLNSGISALLQRIVELEEIQASLVDSHRREISDRDASFHRQSLELEELNTAIAAQTYNREVSEKDVAALKTKLALAQADGRLLISAFERESRQLVQVNLSRWVRLGRWLGFLR